MLHYKEKETCVGNYAAYTTQEAQNKISSADSPKEEKSPEHACLLQML